MNIDRLIAVGSLIFGVIGILLAIYFYRKTIRSKVLAIGYTRATPLMIPVAGVTVSYQGAERKGLSRAFLLFWNKGTSAIERGDFIEPILLKGDEEIIIAKIIDKDTMAAVSVDQDKRAIQIDLLRPGEAFILQIDAASMQYSPDLSITMKSSNMSEVIERLPGIFGLPDGVFDFFTSMLLLLIGILFFSSIIDLKSNSASPVALAAIVLVLIVTIAPIMLRSVLARIKAAYIAPVPLRFFEIKQNREKVFQ